MTSTFTVSKLGTDADKALANLRKYLPAGFEATGRTASKYAGRVVVMEVTHDGSGNVDDCWVLLTSYGMQPSTDLGAYWQGVAGVGK